MELENRETQFTEGLAAEGQNPIWNQSRTLTINAGKNKTFNSNELTSNLNKITFTLFD